MDIRDTGYPGQLRESVFSQRGKKNNPVVLNYFYLVSFVVLNKD